MKEQRTNNRNIAVCITAFIVMFALVVGILAFKFFVLSDSDGKGTMSALTAFLLTCAVMLMLAMAYSVYVISAREELIRRPKTLIVIITTLTGTYLLNVVLATYSYYYLMIALTAFVLAPLSDKKDVFMANMMSAIFTFVTLFVNANFVGTEFNDYVTITLMMILDIVIGSAVTVLLSGSYHRTAFVLVGAVIQSVALALIFGLSYAMIPTEVIDDVVITVLCVYAPVLLALVIQPLFESMFSILSNSKLYELTDHSSPLIKRLIKEAPGTFNHCLSVASYAEVCAIAIGENPHLAKACAYYHDIGKIENPKYFSENQGNSNLHDGLLPEVSAEIIRKHTTDGLELCEKYRIPAEIREVTIQHHGTLPISVFYYKAKGLTDSDVDIYDYCYHGVTPEGKIAAILMICDATEAAIRAMGKPSAEEVDKLIADIINDRINNKQFDNCSITLQDLSVIKSTIIDVYGGHVHKRVQYPSGR